MGKTYFRLKACPRCGGDILVDMAFEDDEICIQCGFREFRPVTHNEHPHHQPEKTVTPANRQANSRVTEKV